MVETKEFISNRDEIRSGLGQEPGMAGQPAGQLVTSEPGSPMAAIAKQKQYNLPVDRNLKNF